MNVISSGIKSADTLITSAMNLLRSAPDGIPIASMLTDGRAAVRVHDDVLFERTIRAMGAPEGIDVLGFARPAHRSELPTIHLSQRALTDPAQGAVILAHEGEHIRQFLGRTSPLERAKVIARAAQTGARQAVDGWRTGTGVLPRFVNGVVTSAVVEKEVPAYLRGGRVAMQLQRPDLTSFAGDSFGGLLDSEAIRGNLMRTYSMA